MSEIEEPSKNPFTNINKLSTEQLNQESGDGNQAKKSVTTILKRVVHQDHVLYGLRVLQFISCVITLILGTLSINFFYKKDKRMASIIFFSCISVLYYCFVHIFQKGLSISYKSLILCCFFMEFFQFTIWLIGFFLIVFRYPSYDCDRQGGSNRVNGCKCGQSALGFIVLNAGLNLAAIVVLLCNIRGEDIEKLRTKKHLLDFIRYDEFDQE